MESKYSKIEWCCIQKNGIKLIEPNEILGRSYLDAADTDLVEMKSRALKVQNLAAYNACYNSFYSLLQKVGIKCEIQDCTFEFFSLISGFTEEQRNLIKILWKNSLDIEQGIKKPKQVDTEPVIEFVDTCKKAFEEITSNQIRLIRQEILLLTKKKGK